MAVGTESSDDEFGILENERCVDKGVFHLFSILTDRLVCFENSRKVRSGFAACRRNTENGCARDLNVARSGTLALSSSPPGPEKLLGEPCVSRRQFSPAVEPARVEEVWTDAMVWTYNQSRQPTLWMYGQCLRLGARPLVVGPGSRWELLPLCPEATVPATAAALAALLRWLAPQNVSRQAGVAGGACSGSLRSRCSIAALERRVLPVSRILEQTWQSGVSLVLPVRDTFLQPQSLLRELIKADGRVRGELRHSRTACSHFDLSCSKK